MPLQKNDQNGHTIVIGSYTDRKSKQSKGIFTTVFDGEQSSEVYYYNYTNLHNYFNFLMDSSSIEKAKKRYAKSDKKQESSYRVKLAPRSVYKHNGIWHFTGEVIEMIDKSAGGYGTMWKQEHTQYSHAVLLGIGEDGKLVWDNSFQYARYYFLSRCSACLHLIPGLIIRLYLLFKWRKYPLQGVR